MADETKTTPAGSGLAPNVAGALAYLLGLITGIIFLLIEKDKFVRFHAMQSILFSVAIIVIEIILGITIVGWFLIPFLGIAVFILWLFLIWKAYNNEEWELPIIGKIAKEQANK